MVKADNDASLILLIFVKSFLCSIVAPYFNSPLILLCSVFTDVNSILEYKFGFFELLSYGGYTIFSPALFCKKYNLILSAPELYLIVFGPASDIFSLFFNI